MVRTAVILCLMVGADNRESVGLTSLLGTEKYKTHISSAFTINDMSHTERSY